MKEMKLWEILIPTHTNNREEIRIEQHKKWDTFVQKITNGLTISKTNKGIWVNQKETRYQETMIPVRIFCTVAQIEKISDFTAKHYKQEAVMYYIVSEAIYITNYDINYEKIKGA